MGNENQTMYRSNSTSPVKLSVQKPSEVPIHRKSAISLDLIKSRPNLKSNEPNPMSNKRIQTPIKVKLKPELNQPSQQKPSIINIRHLNYKAMRSPPHTKFSSPEGGKSPRTSMTNTFSNFSLQSSMVLERKKSMGQTSTLFTHHKKVMKIFQSPIKKHEISTESSEHPSEREKVIRKPNKQVVLSQKVIRKLPKKMIILNEYDNREENRLTRGQQNVHERISKSPSLRSRSVTFMNLSIHKKKLSSETVEKPAEVVKPPKYNIFKSKRASYA